MRRLTAALALVVLAACERPAEAPVATLGSDPMGKPVVYQVFTRLFGNTETANVPWGTAEQNGVGKFADIDDRALAGLRELGVTHVWYTGVPHHALVRDYREFGISDDDPDVIKGRAGSPYAVKDYYSVNPDLALDPARRVEEFEELIERTHRHGMRVLIDIVPNHVARRYESLARPEGVAGFGAHDDTSAEYRRDNNFYYIVDEDFRVPEFAPGYEPLGGEPHPLADGRFDESPAKWTGNGARLAQPGPHDWYETVKINYGVRPDGSHDFPELPQDYASHSHEQHYAFWQGKDVPDSWEKFRDIVLYWLAKGVDGFRYDMAEMVPVAFWSYLNSHIKNVNPDAFLLAEVYDPSRYRDYLHLGKMDYLYDKVEFYDSLKLVMQGRGASSTLADIQARHADIETHLLHFLENHDEQRIASPDFAGDARKGLPAMVVSALISRSPTLVYFGQEVGEPGADDAGFGDPTRTTIFDYWGVPAHQRWMNGGRFDGGALSDAEKSLRDYYGRVLRLSAEHPAMQGEYADIHRANLAAEGDYDERLFSFVRWHGDDRLIVVSNLDADRRYDIDLRLPPDLTATWQLEDGRYALSELLFGERTLQLRVDDGSGRIALVLDPLASVVMSFDAATR